MLINTWLCNVNTLNNARFWEGDFSFPFFKTQIYNCRRFNIVTCCSFHEDFVQTSNFQVLLHNFWTPLNNNFPNKHVKQVEGSRLCAYTLSTVYCNNVNEHYCASFCYVQVLHAAHNFCCCLTSCEDFHISRSAFQNLYFVTCLTLNLCHTMEQQCYRWCFA